MKVRGDREMKITSPKWTPNTVKEETIFRFWKKKKCNCSFLESSRLYLQAIFLGLENHKVKYEQV